MKRELQTTRKVTVVEPLTDEQLEDVRAILRARRLTNQGIDSASLELMSRLLATVDALKLEKWDEREIMLDLQSEVKRLRVVRDADRRATITQADRIEELQDERDRLQRWVSEGRVRESTVEELQAEIVRLREELTRK